MKKILLCIFVFSSVVLSDVIVFRDGISARATILDTAGCVVKINKNNNIIDINKDEISLIVIKNDSISYGNFVCTEEINKNTPKEKSIIYSKTLINDSSLHNNNNDLTQDQNKSDAIKLLPHQIKSNTTKLLPHISLSNDPWAVNSYNINTGFSSSTTFNRHYFSIDNGPQHIRVNYTASNLAPYLKPVPKAYSTIIMYKYCRILTPILMAGGPIIGASIIGLSSHNFSKFNPTGAYIGGFILIFSWIPYGMSQGQVENAIDIYNQDILNKNSRNK